MNIDQIAMCYISIDSSRQALQANGKLFFFLNLQLRLIKYIVRDTSEINIYLYILNIQILFSSLLTNVLYYLPF